MIHFLLLPPLLASAGIVLVSASITISGIGFRHVLQLPQGGLSYIFARDILYDIGKPNRFRQFLIRHSI
jgi:hypothetical protein